MIFIFHLFFFSMKFICANRIAPDGTPRSAASHLGLFCLPMSGIKGTPSLDELMFIATLHKIKILIYSKLVIY